MSTKRTFSNKTAASTRAEGIGLSTPLDILAQTEVLSDKVSACPASTDPMVNDFLVSDISEDMRVNGSITPVVFRAGPAPGKTWHIVSMSIILADLNMQFDEFAGLSISLPNGLLLGVADGGDAITEDFLSGETIQINGDFIKHIGTVARQPFEGTGPNIVAFSIELDFMKRFKKPLILLNGTLEDRLILTVQDDLSAGIDMFNAKVCGWEYTST